MEYIIGYLAVGIMALSAYYGNLSRQNDIKKTCEKFYDAYYKLINKFYPTAALVTLAVDDDGKLLPIENQPALIQEILSSAATDSDISEYYDELNNAFEVVRKAIGKSSKNDRHYLYPLFEVLNVTAAFCAGMEDYEKLNNSDFINNFNIFMTKQDKIKEVLESKLPEKSPTKR